jgi:hypothetical protein
MQIRRHSKISITMEIFTTVPDKTTRAALKRLSDALGYSFLDFTAELVALGFDIHMIALGGSDLLSCEQSLRNCRSESQFGTLTLGWPLVRGLLADASSTY